MHIVFSSERERERERERDRDFSRGSRRSSGAGGEQLELIDPVRQCPIDVGFGARDRSRPITC